MSDNQRQTITASVTYKTAVYEVDAMKNETRCPHARCKKILFKGALGSGTRIEVLCQGCKKMTILEVI